MNPLCECPIAGFCKRHHVDKLGRLHDLCRGTNGVSPQTNAKYWEAWEKKASESGVVKKPKAFKDGFLMPIPSSASSPRPINSIFGEPVGGVGTELKNLLKWFGVGCGKCKQRAAEMDRHGVAWCEENVETIVGWLHDSARRKAIFGFSLEMVPGFDMSANALVKIAIERAKKNYQPKLRLVPSRAVRVPLIGTPIDRDKLQSHILYHVMPLAGSTEWVWRRHLKWIREVRGEFNGRLIIGIVTPGVGDDYRYHSPSEVREEIDGCEAEFIEAPNDIRHGHRRGIGEGVLFPRMLARLETSDPNHVAFYGHCKGVTRPGGRDSVPNRWAEAMFDLLFRNHDEAVELLDYNGVCGSFLMRGGFPMGLPGLGPHYFFSGTFFAMRLVDVFRRNWRQLPQHYGCVEQFPRLLFDLHREVGCIFHDHCGNLYDERAWNEEIQPELDEWKACRMGAGI